MNVRCNSNIHNVPSDIFEKLKSAFPEHYLDHSSFEIVEILFKGLCITFYHQKTEEEKE